jgi:membrane-associated phospholipid phosphatase
MAAALAELYPKNLGVKIAAYSYAALTGIGMTLFTHWASDAVAGALIGYAIGKSVGKSYAELRDRYDGSSGPGTAPQNNMKNTPGFHITENLSFHVLPNSIGINICY